MYDPRFEEEDDFFDEEAAAALDDELGDVRARRITHISADGAEYIGAVLAEDGRTRRTLSGAGCGGGVDSAEATCARRTRGENVDTTDGPWSPIASNSASKP